MNILSLLEEMKQYKAKDQMAALFVDLKSAYNTVNRKTLFSFIQKEEILNQSESVFLENLYDSIYLKTGDNRRPSRKACPKEPLFHLCYSTFIWIMFSKC